MANTLRKSASLILVKPNSDKLGYKVLMLQRSNKGSTFKSAWVFPGGVVDKIDENSNWHSLVSSNNQNYLNHMLPFELSSIRETYEETGILLSDININKDYHQKILSDSTQFLNLYQSKYNLNSTLNSLKLVSEWITPDLPHYKKRFTTKFFLSILSTSTSILNNVNLNEVQNLKWVDPLSILNDNINPKEDRPILMPPQSYQLKRMIENFPKFKDLEIFHQRLPNTKENLIKFNSDFTTNWVYPFLPKLISTKFINDDRIETMSLPEYDNQHHKFDNIYLNNNKGLMDYSTFTLPNIKENINPLSIPLNIIPKSNL